jgi:hypothetical protein
MPTTHIDRDVTLEEAERVLSRELGPGYEIRRKTGSSGLTVKRNRLLWANVHSSPTNGGTTFSVHGGGLILNRLYSEVALARKVAAAIDRSLSTSTRAN